LHEGEFHLSGSLAPEAAFNDIAQRVDAEIARLASAPASEEELERAKTQLIASALFARDSQYYMALIFGSSAVMGIAPEAVLGWQALVEDVTAADVQRAVATLLVPQHSLTGHLTRAGEANE
jgi:zinc protease